MACEVQVRVSRASLVGQPGRRRPLFGQSYGTLDALHTQSAHLVYISIPHAKRHARSGRLATWVVASELTLTATPTGAGWTKCRWRLGVAIHSLAVHGLPTSLNATTQQLRYETWTHWRSVWVLGTAVVGLLECGSRFCSFHDPVNRVQPLLGWAHVARLGVPYRLALLDASCPAVRLPEYYLPTYILS